MRPRAGRLGELVALWTPPILLLASVLLLAEVYLRYQRFGDVAIRRPLAYMAPNWRDPDCVIPGAGGEPMTPGCRMHHKGVWLETNSAGLNDREVDETRPHFRVLVLGDSLSMADGVAQPDIYHSRLETRMNREIGSPGFVEFYNHARGGRTTARELADLERAAQRWPLDAVLVGVSPSDLWENVQERETCGPEHEPLRFSSAERKLYDRSVRGRNGVTRAVGDLEAATGLWVANRLRDLLRGWVRAANSSAETRQELARLEADAIAAFRLCAGRIREIADREGVELAWAVLWYEPDRHAEFLLRELQALGEPAIGLMDAHQSLDADVGLTIYDGDPHPGAAVHGAFAERLYPWLLELGWLERARATLRAP